MATRFQVVCFTLGLLTVWVASDWPMHDVAERYNYSIHMVQHLMFSMVVSAAPAPRDAGMAPAAALQPPASCALVRTMARFVPALLLFNIVLVVTHWPFMVNESLNSGLVHFTLHAVLFVSSLIVWLPIVSPLPEIPRLAAGHADALPVRVVGRAHRARVVPHVRFRAALQVLREPCRTCSGSRRSTTNSSRA